MLLAICYFLSEVSYQKVTITCKNKSPFATIVRLAIFFCKLDSFKFVKYCGDVIQSQRRDNLDNFVITKYYTDVILSCLCDKIMHT